MAIDLMTSTTTYAKLYSKYQGFRAPTARILVEGKEVVSARTGRLLYLSVELTSGFEASGCRFSMLGEYDFSQSDFSADGPAAALQIGAKVTVELGYIVTEPVFTGLVTRVEYHLDSSGEPRIEAECMDAKCLLMKSQRLQIRSERKMSQVVQALLSEQPFSGYVTDKTIDSFGQDEMVIPTALESDYHFLCEQAEYYGREFFILQGKLFFRERPASSSPVMTIDPKQMLISAQLSLSGEKLLKKVTVKGLHPDGAQEISGEATVSGKFSEGSTAARMIGATERVEFDPLVTSAGEAAGRAKRIAGRISESFATLECRGTGIPELAPGRYVKIQKFSRQADKTYYIVKVRHQMSASGYFTTFEAKGESL